MHMILISGCGFQAENFSCLTVLLAPLLQIPGYVPDDDSTVEDSVTRMHSIIV